MYDGVINVYKEKGFTSHDVVAKLRGILRQKKIGHTGTLDPDAVGVLPVCLGKGTKLCDVLTDKTKAYRAVLLLGVETDTEDAGGEILNRCPPERLTAQIADVFMEELKPHGVMVLIEAEHMCMTMRGIKKPGAKTVTVVTRGVFNDDEKLQNQFYRMLERR